MYSAYHLYIFFFNTTIYIYIYTISLGSFRVKAIQCNLMPPLLLFTRWWHLTTRSAFDWFFSARTLQVSGFNVWLCLSHHAPEALLAMISCGEREMAQGWFSPGFLKQNISNNWNIVGTSMLFPGPRKPFFVKRWDHPTEWTLPSFASLKLVHIPILVSVVDDKNTQRLIISGWRPCRVGWTVYRPPRHGNQLAGGVLADQLPLDQEDLDTSKRWRFHWFTEWTGAYFQTQNSGTLGSRRVWEGFGFQKPHW